MPHAVIYFPRDFELLLANGAIYISLLLECGKIVFLVSILSTSEIESKRAPVQISLQPFLTTRLEQYSKFI